MGQHALITVYSLLLQLYNYNHSLQFTTPAV